MTVRRLLAFLLLVSFTARSFAAFGQNQVNVHDFRWTVARTAHFNIHYTSESKAMLPFAAVTAERAYERLTRSLSVTPSEPTDLFLFADHNQFEENNIASVDEGTGGVTEAFKDRIIVYNDGTKAWLEHVITHEYSHVLEFEVLYGGFWKSARLLKSPLYPLWFMEGLAEFGIGDIDQPEEDLYLRDAALDRALYSLMDLHGFAHLKPHQTTLAYKSGASALRFLSEEFGPDVPGRLLKGLRERFEAGSVTAELTRQDFRFLDQRWRESLTDLYTAQAARLGLREPEAYGTRLTESAGLPSFQQAPTLSPDGNFLAFLTDRNGPPEVMLTDFRTGVTRLLAGRQWSSVEYIHADGRALSFSSDGRWLAFSGEKEERDYLYLYDLKHERLRRVRTPFGQIRSPVFHPWEDRLAVVGMRDGTNDLYEITPRGKLLRRLTRSSADVGDPAWSPDGKTIVFSVEVPAPGKYERNLAALDVETLAVRPLTDMPGDERSPVFTPDGRSVIFVGEALEGVRNLYRLDLASGRVLLLTRVIGGNFWPCVSRDGRRIVFSSYRHNSENIYTAGPELWNPPPGKEETAYSRQPLRVAADGKDAGEPLEERKTEAGRLETGKLSDLTATPPDLITGESPYRFRASTVLFFPVLYYSSQDGFYIASLWQASEELGNHEVQGTVQYGSGTHFLDYQGQYVFKRFRPQFVVGAGGETAYQDINRVERRRDWDREVGVVYPLDRFRRVEVFATGVHQEDIFRGEINTRSVSQENTGSVSFVRDTTTGNYLVITDGSRFDLTQIAARPVLGGSRHYDATETEAQRFLPTGGESALALRGVAGASGGSDPRLFRIGGGDRLRGYSRNDLENQSSRYAIGTVEWRMPLKYIDSPGVPFLPELAFKALFGALFVDAGYDGTPGDRTDMGIRRSRASVGAGFRIPAFVFQTYPLTIAVDLAKRVDADIWVWYLYLGPRF